MVDEVFRQWTMRMMAERTEMLGSDASPRVARLQSVSLPSHRRRYFTFIIRNKLSKESVSSGKHPNSIESRSSCAYCKSLAGLVGPLAAKSSGHMPVCSDLAVHIIDVLLFTAVDGRPSPNSSLRFSRPRLNSAHQL
ncbi:hypothetical protein EVAR_68833_1 [Eumeta japonica]|uniref:Uncharacterized protein n=1 Tax=Eumeta variegata TaxID=151549 RepID=A0A4C1SRD8_EUMVA|nr:hypothetical protein EVAR_68833_1 [Eumeta japonica]